MKIFKKIVISLLMGVVIYLGYCSVYLVISPEEIVIPRITPFGIIPAVASFVALIVNDLVDVIKKK